MERILLAIMYLVPVVCLLLLEVLVTIDLVRLLFRPAGEPIPPRLASQCFIWLVLLPGVVVGGYWTGFTIDHGHGHFSTQPLFELMFSPWSAGFVLFALVSIGAWLWFILRRPARLYASPLVLAPPVVMATIYLTFSILYACSEVKDLLVPPSGLAAPTVESAAMFGGVILMVPIAAIVDLVLLTIHVTRTQMFRRRLAGGGPAGDAD